MLLCNHKSIFTTTKKTYHAVGVGGRQSNCKPVTKSTDESLAIAGDLRAVHKKMVVDQSTSGD